MRSIRGISVPFSFIIDLLAYYNKFLKDHYEEMLYILHPRRTVVDNVNRMLNCGAPSYGSTMYGCPKVRSPKICTFSLPQSLLPHLWQMYSIHRTTSMSAKLIQCTHRHCVFTIAQELRHFFLEDRSLLNCLFSAVCSVILHMFHLPQT